jgi:hypothetical protein
VTRVSRAEGGAIYSAPRHGELLYVLRGFDDLRGLYTMLSLDFYALLRGGDGVCLGDVSLLRFNRASTTSTLRGPCVVRTRNDLLHAFIYASGLLVYLQLVD